VDHFRQGNARLRTLLESAQVLVHPFVVGELACGNWRARRQILTLLQGLPAVAPVSDDEVLALLDRHRLHGGGLGWVDVHLLAAAMMAGVEFWTLDRRLAAAARTVLRGR
jgi:predicted nucleic acid-binding protein